MPNKKKITKADKAGTDADIRVRAERLGKHNEAPPAPADPAQPVVEDREDGIEVATAVTSPNQFMVNVLITSAEPITVQRVTAARNAIRSLSVLVLAMTDAQLHDTLITLHKAARIVEQARHSAGSKNA